MAQRRRGGHHAGRKMLCVIWSDTAFYAAVAAPIGEPDTLLDVRCLVQGAERGLAEGGVEVSLSWASCLLGFTFVGTVLQLLFFPLPVMLTAILSFFALHVFCCLFAQTNDKLGGFQFNFSDFYL